MAEVSSTTTTSSSSYTEEEEEDGGGDESVAYLKQLAKELTAGASPASSTSSSSMFVPKKEQIIRSDSSMDSYEYTERIKRIRKQEEEAKKKRMKEANKTGEEDTEEAYLKEIQNAHYSAIEKETDKEEEENIFTALNIKPFQQPLHRKERDVQRQLEKKKKRKLPMMMISSTGEDQKKKEEEGGGGGKKQKKKKKKDKDQSLPSLQELNGAIRGVTNKKGIEQDAPLGMASLNIWSLLTREQKEAVNDEDTMPFAWNVARQEPELLRIGSGMDASKRPLDRFALCHDGCIWRFPTEDQLGEFASKTYPKTTASRWISNAERDKQKKETEKEKDQQMIGEMAELLKPLLQEHRQKVATTNPEEKDLEPFIQSVPHLQYWVTKRKGKDVYPHPVTFPDSLNETIEDFHGLFHSFISDEKEMKRLCSFRLIPQGKEPSIYTKEMKLKYEERAAKQWAEAQKKEGKEKLKSESSKATVALFWLEDRLNELNVKEDMIEYMITKVKSKIDEQTATAPSLVREEAAWHQSVFYWNNISWMAYLYYHHELKKKKKEEKPPPPPQPSLNDGEAACKRVEYTSEEAKYLRTKYPHSGTTSYNGVVICTPLNVAGFPCSTMMPGTHICWASINKRPNIPLTDILSRDINQINKPGDDIDFYSIRFKNRLSLDWNGTQLIVSAAPPRQTSSSTDTTNEKTQKEEGEVIAYARVTELNGWEKEEWFRWFEIKTEEEKKEWLSLAERLKPFNKRVSEKRWKQVQEEIQKQKSKPSMYAQYGLSNLEPPPALTNTMLTEFHVDIKTVAQYNSEIQDEGEEDDENEEDEEAWVRTEWNAIKKGDATFRRLYYSMGKASKYTHKHSKPSPTVLSVLRQLTDDDKIHKCFYKNETL